MDYQIEIIRVDDSQLNMNQTNKCCLSCQCSDHCQCARFQHRVDQRGFGVVRSDAELKELMYELYEQEEVCVCVCGCGCVWVCGCVCVCYSLVYNYDPPDTGQAIFRVVCSGKAACTLTLMSMCLVSVNTCT